VGVCIATLEELALGDDVDPGMGTVFSPGVGSGVAWVVWVRVGKGVGSGFKDSAGSGTVGLVGSKEGPGVSSAVNGDVGVAEDDFNGVGIGVGSGTDGFVGNEVGLGIDSGAGSIELAVGEEVANGNGGNAESITGAIVGD